jgi:hypothetical protein
VRFSYLPTLRAQLALSRHDSAAALELLHAAAANELGVPPSGFFGLFGALYPIYVRGEAYLAKRQGPEAATEFRKIIEHRGIVVANPIGAVSRLQLARAFAMSGETVKAKTAYEDFLKMWARADADSRMLTAAKEEYSRLH